MLAVLAAIRCWKHQLQRCRVVLFTDSESVRGSFLKHCDLILETIFREESNFDPLIWIERVPSQSTSDFLSRNEVSEYVGVPDG